MPIAAFSRTHKGISWKKRSYHAMRTIQNSSQALQLAFYNTQKCLSGCVFLSLNLD